jgi:hypothetical protein
MSGKLIEIAYVVEDLGSAIEHWTSDMGVGPFFTGIYDIPDQIYRGEPVPTRMNIAFAMSNGVLLELIQPLSGGGCIFSEAGPGFHHIMFELADHDAEVARLEARGFEVVQSGSFAGSAYSIVDTRSATGCFTEVMACGPGLQGLIARLRQASEAWDGKTEPVRSLFG